MEVYLNQILIIKPSRYLLISNIKIEYIKYIKKWFIIKSLKKFLYKNKSWKFLRYDNATF